jgi:hypothetical protein
MKTISETEHARLAQWFLCEPLERMGVLGFPASGQRTWPFCPPCFKGTDSRLCEVQTSARGGKHVHEFIVNGFGLKEMLWIFNRRRRELEGSQPASPHFICSIQPK